jgi:TolB-like protein
MKNALCLILLLPAAAYSDPAYPIGNTCVAVFNFQADGGFRQHSGVADAGKSVASLLTHDLSVLEPIKVVDRDAIQEGQGGHLKINLGDPITPEDAKRIGRDLGATALVTGRIFGSRSQVIIAAKVVSARTGETLGAMVKGDQSTPIVDLISQLGAQVASIAMKQNGVEGTPWPPATIVGTRERSTRLGTSIPHDEVACVLAIDGRVIPDEVEKWSQPQTLLPGIHEIFIRYYDGTDIAGHSFVFNARPGGSYEVYCEKPHLSMASGNTLLYPTSRNIPASTEGPKLWIRDQRTHEPVTAVAQVSLDSKPDEWTDFQFRGLNDISTGDNPDFVRPPASHPK